MVRRFVVVFALVGTLFAQTTVKVGSTRPPTELFAASKAARADGRFRMLLRQFRAYEPTLPERHEAGLRPACVDYQGHTGIPAGHWVWVRPFWFVFRDGPDESPHNRQWGPEQACGAPDTLEAADRATAWASRLPDEGQQWLLLEYATPLRMAKLCVHESLQPGALAAVAVLTPQGEELELWRNDAPQAPEEASRVLQLDVPVGFVVERVLLRFACDRVPGWNEIDAVGIVDVQGVTHWAAAAAASSTYADALEAAAVPNGPVAPGAAAGPAEAPAAGAAAEARPERPVQRLVVELGGLAEPPPAPPTLEQFEQLQKRIVELEAQVRALEARLRRFGSSNQPPK
ncbi:MAG: hypothetical protein U1F60_10260 [Planctomycetota bacterium]